MVGEEEAAQLADAVPIEGLDFSSVDPRMLAQMDRDTLAREVGVSVPTLQRLLRGNPWVHVAAQVEPIGLQRVRSDWGY